MSRMDVLLEAAADALREGRAVPDHQLLVEHEVTLDEAYDLAEQIANAIVCMNALVKAHEPRAALVADGDAGEGGGRA